MERTNKEKLILFTENAQIIRKEFHLQNTLTKRLAALLYTQENKTVDCDAIRHCHQLIKQNTGIFSTFRGNTALCVATLLSLSTDPQTAFKDTLKVYDMLKDVKFRASDFLAVAAYQIAAHSDTFSYSNVVERTRSFYHGMKTRHFFYTGQNDYIFSSMLGLTDLDVAEGTERIEQLYNRLKGEFWDKNSVQALAQVLVLGNSDDNVTERVLALNKKLRMQKIKMDKAYTLPILGILALIPVELDTIVNDMKIARDTLRTQKGFSSWTVTTQELLLFVASIVSSNYADSINNGILTAALSTSITNIIIAQQIATVAAISATTAATASSTT